MGNIGSLFNALIICVKVRYHKPNVIEKSHIAILPGVVFHKAMKIIKKFYDNAIKNIIQKGDYLFCICLGIFWHQRVLRKNLPKV